MLEIRLSSIEKELQDQKTKMSTLESTRLKSVEKELQAQKNQLSFLETKQDSKFHEIQDVVSILKTSLTDRSRSKHKREAFLVNTSSSNSVKKNQKAKKERCSDSSRVCTFFYPDHADAVNKRTKNGFSLNSTKQDISLKDTSAFPNSSQPKWNPISPVPVSKEPLKGHCSDSSRFCTFFHPDHPDAITKGTDDGSSLTEQQVQQVHAKAERPSLNNRPPTSCEELKQLGHALNGFYLVQGPLEKSNKILTIYCNFIDDKTKSGFQK